MLGAAIGDFVGSKYEFRPIKSKDFEIVPDECVYTDDTVMTIAVGQAIISGTRDFASHMRYWGNAFITSYGPHFWKWLTTPEMPAYGSWSNGASMRVSPAAWFARSTKECLALAKASSEVSHDHPEAVRGAQAVALAIFAARSGWSKTAVRELVSEIFGYDLTRSVDEIRPDCSFELKSFVCVPEAITCALEATSFEDAIRNAVSLGGDADTQAAIAGAIAEAWFPIPTSLRNATLSRMPDEMREAIVHLVGEAKSVEWTPMTKEDAESIPRWNPDIVRRWQEERYPQIGQDRQLLKKWEAIEAGMQHVPAATSAPKRPINIVRAIRNLFTPTSKARIELVLGDICNQQVDAIVNAADASLLGGTGVDGAIRAAAGPRMALACQELGGLRGRPKATPGFDLPAAHVIHAAAPVWASVLGPKDLARWFTMSIEVAAEVDAKSIAFPLLGAGVFGWPIEFAVEAARIGIKRGIARNRQIRLVRVVAFSRRDFEALQDEFGIDGVEEEGARMYHTGAV